MLVFATSVKHPNNSQSYEEVWQLLNNTLYSVCSQLDTDFRVVVVCDKQMPLFHHHELIEKYTEFVEVDFPSHGENVLNNFDRLGNLSPSLENPKWWADKLIPEDYFHIANVVLNMASKHLIGVLAAKKYDPEYVCFFDADDYIGNDISAYVNSCPGQNGWIMVHGYRMYENNLATFSRHDSICGTGNIFNYSLLMNYLSSRVNEKSSQNELFEYVDSEFLITHGKHRDTQSYFTKEGSPFLEFPTRSVIHVIGHNESSETNRLAIRNEPLGFRLKQKVNMGKFSPISPPLIRYFNVLPKNFPKVFCLGFHKTGTSSIYALLQDMGYHVSQFYKSNDDDFCASLERGDLSELKQVSEVFDAFQDDPYFLFYKEFDQWYPGSKFILTTRDSRSWWASCLNFFHMKDISIHKYIYGYTNPVGHEEVYIERFERHTRDVLKYFKDRPDDLLVINVSEDGALEKISSFLGKDSSYTKMPHKNSKLVIKQKQEPESSVFRRIKRIRPVSALRIVTFNAPPVIVGGCKGSGIRQMLSLLSCHPNIYAATDNLPLNQIKRHPSLIQIMDKNRKENDLLDVYDEKKWYYRLATKKIPFTCHRWAAGSELSVLAFDQILEQHKGNVRIINMVRDGRDVVTERHPMVPEQFAVTPKRWIHDSF